MTITTTRICVNISRSALDPEGATDDADFAFVRERIVEVLALHFPGAEIAEIWSGRTHGVCDGESITDEVLDAVKSAINSCV